MKTEVHTKTCVQMFIVALFGIAKFWEQPEYLSTGEELNKLCCCHTKGNYTAIERDYRPIHNSDGSQGHYAEWTSRSQKVTDYDSTYMTFQKSRNFSKGGLVDWWVGGCRDAVGGRQVRLYGGSTRGLCGEGAALHLDSRGGYSKPHAW